MVIELKTLNDTKKLARRIAKKIKCNELILLSGDLGSGKTTFTRYLIMALGFPEDTVKSPSFTIVQEYLHHGKSVYHIDLYRIEKESELKELGLEEILSEQSLVIVEWPEAGKKVFENCGREILKINFCFNKGRRSAYLTNLNI